MLCTVDRPARLTGQLASEKIGKIANISPAESMLVHMSVEGRRFPVRVGHEFSWITNCSCPRAVQRNVFFLLTMSRVDPRVLVDHQFCLPTPLVLLVFFGNL
jgi:hypothetical protein